MKTQLVTSLKRRATRILAELEEDRRPILITHRGNPSAYLIDVKTFHLLQERMHILEGIARGEKAVQEGRSMTHEAAKKKMKRWLR